MMHSRAHPGTRILELTRVVRWGRRMAVPPCCPPPGPGQAAQGTTVEKGKRTCHWAAAASCQWVS
eukprot:6119067-Heterocapsa_arctica.AAC.1